MKLGIGITTFPWPAEEIGPRVARIATAADEAGVDSLWVMDHFFQIRVTGLPPESPMPEAYATLGFLGGLTKRIRLGTLVTSVAYRHPGVLVKTVTALDVLTGGRVIFGVGAGAPWNVAPAGPGPGMGRVFEAEGLGIPFPSLAERFERLEELLQIAHQMWRGDETPYQGTHYQLVRPLNSPNSLQRPHPPILIGGSGEGKTLRLVAQYADACNLFPTPQLPHKLDVLRDHCKTLGRNYDEIEKTALFGFDVGENGEKVGQVIGGLRWLASMGIQTVIGSVPRIDRIKPLEIIGEKVIPAVAGLEASTAGAAR
jgi:F420-dependent oxidoreductase-like protein